MTFKFWAAAGALAIMLSYGLDAGVAAPRAQSSDPRGQPEN
jgi:hypothetical protein